jgi:hypothetical protein
MIIEFTTTSADYDLFQSTNIQDQIKKHFGESYIDSIAQGNTGMKLTVFVNSDSTTGIKFNINDNYQSFIRNIVYSRSGIIYPKNCYIKDSGISGQLMIQIV